MLKGIDRSVKLYTTARDVYFSDVNLLTSVTPSSNYAELQWDVVVDGDSAGQSLVRMSKLVRRETERQDKGTQTETENKREISRYTQRETETEKKREIARYTERNRDRDRDRQ